MEQAATSRRRFAVPSYRHHKQSGQAIVTLSDGLGNRRDVLLGRYGSAESKAEYRRVRAEWEAAGQRLPQPASKPAPDRTVNELALAYYRFAKRYYVKDGRPTSEVATIKPALRFLKRLYGHTAAKDFGPLALKAIRQAMATHDVSRKVQVRDPETGKVACDPTTGKPLTEVRVYRHGLARRFVNKQIGRIKRLFAWAVEEELLPASVHQALLRVKGLKKGKGEAREKAR
jgi:hypothetical protein